MKATTFPALLAAVLLLLPPTSAGAQEFEQGTWTLHLTGSYIHSENAGLSHEQADGGALKLGLGYYFADAWALVGELAGYGLEQDEPEIEAWGGGFNLLLRWHFIREESFSIFADGGAGLVEFDEDFPNGGTRFNFTPQVGVGASLRLGDRTHLLSGVRYLHISNARIHGEDENPGMDSVEVYAGLLWTF